jgi:hypothetical protein
MSLKLRECGENEEITEYSHVSEPMLSCMFCLSVFSSEGYLLLCWISRSQKNTIIRWSRKAGNLVLLFVSNSTGISHKSYWMILGVLMRSTVMIFFFKWVSFKMDWSIYAIRIDITRSLYMLILHNSWFRIHFIFVDTSHIYYLTLSATIVFEHMAFSHVQFILFWIKNHHTQPSTELEYNFLNVGKSDIGSFMWRNAKLLEQIQFFSDCRNCQPKPGIGLECDFCEC